LSLGDQILQVIISGITSGCIYAVVGLAIAVVYNVTRMFDLSQGMYVMLGAMLVCVFQKLGLCLGISIVLALIIPFSASLLIWRILFYSSSQRYPTITLTMITVGLGLLIEGIAFLTFGTDVRVGPYYLNITPIRVSGASISPQAPLIYASLLLALFGLSFLFGRTILGKALRACHERPLAARLMGISPRNMMYFSFVLAVCLGALGGIIMVPYTAASYSMGWNFLIKGLLAAVAGGVSKFQGVIVGGLVLGLLESVAAGFISSSYASIITFTIFVIILLFRPTGLIGGREISGWKD